MNPLSRQLHWENWRWHLVQNYSVSFCIFCVSVVFRDLQWFVTNKTAVTSCSLVTSWMVTKILIHISTTTLLGTSRAVLLNPFSIICGALQVRNIDKVKPAGVSHPALYCTGASQGKYGWVMRVILVMLKKIKHNINCAQKYRVRNRRNYFSLIWFKDFKISALMKEFVLSLELLFNNGI